MENVENCLNKNCGPSRRAYIVFVLEIAFKYSKELKKLKEQKDSGKISKMQFYEKYDQLLHEAQEDKKYKAFNTCARSKCKSVFKDQIKVLIELCQTDDKYKYYEEIFKKTLKDKEVAKNTDFVQVLKDMRRFFMDFGSLA